MTCDGCEIKMKPGKALENTWITYSQLECDNGKSIKFKSVKEGPARMIAVLKCPECGHSKK